ncbi:hypothetical protein MJT46_008000 [Ovis ammon polii x Ovis aries]|nr:hypothetical protein MJT46_008000 [Ovis ammon polii x Ovis aries]
MQHRRCDPQAPLPRAPRLLLPPPPPPPLHPAATLGRATAPALRRCAVASASNSVVTLATQLRKGSQPAVNEHCNTGMEQSASCKFVCFMRHMTVNQFAKVSASLAGYKEGRQGHSDKKLQKQGSKSVLDTRLITDECTADTDHRVRCKDLFLYLPYDKKCHQVTRATELPGLFTISVRSNITTELILQAFSIILKSKVSILRTAQLRSWYLIIAVPSTYTSGGECNVVKDNREHVRHVH